MRVWRGISFVRKVGMLPTELPGNQTPNSSYRSYICALCLPRRTPSFAPTEGASGQKHKPSLTRLRISHRFKQRSKKAALAKNSRDKRYSHQRRLKRVALQHALGVLSEQAMAIGKGRSFDDLFALVEAGLEPITGLGELYVYLGAKLNRASAVRNI